MARKEIPPGVHVTYRLQYQNCGKCTLCRANKKHGHGPYWYCFYRENGMRKSGYIGKVHPQDAAVTTVKEVRQTT